MNNIQKAIKILQDEDYKVDHKMMPFSIFQSFDLENDKIKGYIRINEHSKYELDFLYVTFNVSICKMVGSDELTTEDNRNIAKYMQHLCDVVDALNGLNIVLHRDLREIQEYL